MGADDAARGVGGELEDLLDGQRRVDRHRGVGQRAQLLDVLVLEPRDLLHLGVAAVDALEDRQALAQEVACGADGRLRRPDAPPASASRTRRVVRLREVEHAHAGGHGLAPEVVGDAEARLALVP